MSVSDLRKDYSHGELTRKDLAQDPIKQFADWFSVAQSCAGITEANAVTLATAGANGRVTARTVLLKAFDERGFVFYTNTGSNKAGQLAENPQAALLFPWLPLERQVSISGQAEKVSAAETQAYFVSRPFLSRIGALASPQSRIISTRKILEEKFEELKGRYADGDVPLPDFWSGYRIVPNTVEFWQGRSSRLHDRFLYTRQPDNSWSIDRLAP